MPRATAKKEVPEISEEGVTTTDRTLLLNTVDGDFRITIPSGARVTFGPTIPFERKDGGYRNQSDRAYSLRVYENARNDSLMAVFSGVNSFRDIGMPYAKLIIREAGKSVWRSDEEGYKVEEEVNRKSAWADSLHMLEEKAEGKEPF